jgi:predicted nucleotidyltransferase
MSNKPTKEIIKELVAKIAPNYPTLKVLWLVGLYAKDEQTELSKISIVVNIDFSIDEADYCAFEKELEELFPTKTVFLIKLGKKGLGLLTGTEFQGYKLFDSTD